MNIDLAIEEIRKIESLTDKLNYYNKNVASLIKIDNHNHEVGFGIGHEKYKLFCLCSRCKHKFSKTDFEIYKNLRNQETQKVVDFFESTLDYKTKIEYYFQISEGFSKTTRILYFVPDNLEEINNEISYQKYTINITPKDENEKKIIEVHLKEKLINHTCKWTVSLSQFTYEKRVEKLKKYLQVRKDEKRRAEFIQSEYDNINLSKIEKNEDSMDNKYLIKILTTVEDILQDRHFEDYTEFNKINITILAKDVIRYEEFLNSLPAKFQEEEPELSNQERNVLQLNQYYNSITHRSIFKEAIINNKDDLYYYKRTTAFIENRNKDLAENKILSTRSGWLQPFNRKIKNFLDQTVSCYKLVMEWKDENTNLQASGLELRMSKEMEFFRQLPDSLRKNYDNNDDFLVFKMREYYINGFRMMLDFLKSDLMINLEKSPFHIKLQEVIDEVKNAVDIESLKLSLNYQSAKNLNQESIKDISKPVNKELKKEKLYKRKLPLKELDFNLENLFTIGLTPETLKTNFEQWVTDNEDILIDFKNNKIYSGVINAKREMAEMLEKIAISMEKRGMSQNQIDEFLISEKQKSTSLIKEKCDLIPDDQVYDFNLRLILKSFESYEELKEKYFDSMMDEILKVDSPSNFSKNEILLSRKQVDNIEEFNEQNINPYPKIFKNFKAFTIFKGLHAEFGNTKENLSNYSFVFHKMTYEDLIHNDIKQKSYYDFLGEFNISIDRIKPLADIGKIPFRESIYTKAKE